MRTVYKADQEMAGNARDVSALVVRKKEESDRVVQIVQQYTTDTAVGFIHFLDEEVLMITRNKLHQIISCFKKGYV